MEEENRLWLNDLVPADDVEDDYDSTTAAFNLGVVLRWEYRPGSLAYLVYTGTFGLDQEQTEFRFRRVLGDLFSETSRHTLMLKLSYLWS